MPMTLVRSASYRIIQALERDGIETFFIVLEASHQSIHDRIIARGEEEGCWCMENIEMARSGCAALPGSHIDTEGRDVEELTRIVMNEITAKR